MPQPIPTAIADGIELDRARNQLPAALVCIAIHLYALWFGCQLFGTKRFVNATWPIGAPVLAFYALSAYASATTIRENSPAASKSKPEVQG